ncbi:GNAT family N-acetyltransferase [Vibrio gallaecicus]|nr:GNAT family N-acetyltransferase [Vibrio gallaecicus]MDN3616891.1 GNAT family N-acetyltransferase [Vibrio gallaecicus]
MVISLLADSPSDSHKIAQWYYDEWANHANTTLEMVVLDVMTKSINRDDFPMTFICKLNNDLIGVAELKLQENTRLPEYKHWLGGVFVDPSHRLMGVASQLIFAALDKAKALGVGTLYLECEPHNTSLYHRHGFNVDHSSSETGGMTVIMSKTFNT